jgi:hypothetical protein
MVSSYVGENKHFEKLYLSGQLEVELTPQVKEYIILSSYSQRFSGREHWLRSFVLAVKINLITKVSIACIQPVMANERGWNPCFLHQYCLRDSHPTRRLPHQV